SVSNSYAAAACRSIGNSESRRSGGSGRTRPSSRQRPPSVLQTILTGPAGIVCSKAVCSFQQLEQLRDRPAIVLDNNSRPALIIEIRRIERHAEVAEDCRCEIA